MQWQDQDQPKADGTTFCTSRVDWLVLVPQNNEYVHVWPSDVCPSSNKHN